MVFPALARMVEFWWNGNALLPARHDWERSANGAIPLCESGRDGVQSSGTPAVTVSRLRSPSEDVSVA